MKFLLVVVSLFYLFAGCQRSRESVLELKKWELDVGNGFVKTEPVPWQFAPLVGGIGADHHGIGIYRTYFDLPSGADNRLLAFYTDCIDDADEIFLNGHLIGRTGRIPENNRSFRSAAREARVAPLQMGYLVPRRNEITIRVYDFAGVGGFCYRQQPLIADIEGASALERAHRWANDIPRTIGLAGLLFFFARSVLDVIRRWRILFSPAVVNFLLMPYRPGLKGKQGTAASELVVKSLLTAIFCFTAFLFLINETTYKYLLMDSENFFFKGPTIGFVIGMLAMVHLFYPEVFRRETQTTGSGRITTGVFAVLSHPILVVAFLIYMILVPPAQAWDNFTLYGIGLVSLILLILFGMTIANLFIASKSRKRGERRLLRIEAMARLLALCGMLTSAILWFVSTTLFQYSFLNMVVFFLIYLWLSARFTRVSGLLLPLQERNFHGYFSTLQTNFHLTYQEARICEELRKGVDRPEIARLLGIRDSTMKIHLKSIYGKTIEKGHRQPTASRNKLQRLTIFLQGL